MSREAKKERSSDMGLQKDILSLTGNLKFKENSRVEKSIPQCPTLSEAMSVSEEEEAGLFAGIGADVFVFPKSDVLDDGSLKDGWQNDVVQVNPIKAKSHFSIEAVTDDDRNPFNRCFPITLELDSDRSLFRSDKNLVKYILPYHSRLPWVDRDLLDNILHPKHKWMIPDRFLPRFEVSQVHSGLALIYADDVLIGPYVGINFDENRAMYDLFRAMKNEHLSAGYRLKLEMEK